MCVHVFRCIYLQRLEGSLGYHPQECRLLPSRQALSLAWSSRQARLTTEGPSRKPLVSEPLPEGHTPTPSVVWGSNSDLHTSFADRAILRAPSKARNKTKMAPVLREKGERTVQQIHASENVLNDLSCVACGDPHLRWQIAPPLLDCTSFLRKPTCAS